MPFVVNSGKATTDLIGELLAEFARPLSVGFVADDDATSGQQLLHHAQTEREAEKQPHRVADDLGKEPIPGVAREQMSSPHPTTHPVVSAAQALQGRCRLELSQTIRIGAAE
jgi:hypothetical protein